MTIRSAYTNVPLVIYGVVTQLDRKTWHHISSAHNPDKDIEYWIRGWGEFSLAKEDAFNNHLKRLEYLNNFHRNKNGKKIKAVLQEEGLIFGRRGLEELL